MRSKEAEDEYEEEKNKRVYYSKQNVSILNVIFEIVCFMHAKHI